MENLIKISLRQNAVYLPASAVVKSSAVLSETVSVLVANIGKLGFAVSEDLLKALGNTTPAYQLKVLETLKEVAGVNKNWVPLVKNWGVPTGESILDHIITFYSNIFSSDKKGTRLQCGHLIPANTFPLERYNGCPFCGTPFVAERLDLKGQGSRMKVLELWTDKELNAFYKDLLSSKTALDATQADSLRTLLKALPLSEATIGMKETLMLVIDTYVKEGMTASAQGLFRTPTDIMRYLWYKHTGFLQIIEPSTIIKRKGKNSRNIHFTIDRSGRATADAKTQLRLKYKRKDCLMVATWLNNLEGEVELLCEIMHPKRAMWVRFIRALRLAEYSRKEGFEKLRNLLDVFYNQDYDVWQGRVNYYRARSDADKTFAFLKQRPGLFARSLFSNMLWFGPEITVNEFAHVADKVPARLMISLNMYAENYFNASVQRSVKPLGGVNKRVPANKFLTLYRNKDLEAMKQQVEWLTLDCLRKRFAAAETKNKTIYIDPSLFNMPLAIGDRSESVQDLPAALMGTRFPVEGNSVRLFMQWGQGLPAQHMDMDLSCLIAYENRTDSCSFSRLYTGGCRHSGDIRSIPHLKGTAEYIELDLKVLRSLDAKYVTFVSNAYSNGSITPGLVVGWMNSAYPMEISERSGVAYDPSCVQHQVRITQGLAKGLVFGVLDVEKVEIIWLEMTFSGQVVQQLDVKGVKTMLNKLKSKMSIGNMLKIKAEAQGLELAETPEADEVYTWQWGLNSAAVLSVVSG